MCYKPRLYHNTGLTPGRRRDPLQSHFLLQIRIYRIEEFFSIKILLFMIDHIAMNTYRKVFGHFSAFNCFDANGFECVAKVDEWLIVIQFSTKRKSPRPGENRRDRVG